MARVRETRRRGCAKRAGAHGKHRRHAAIGKCLRCVDRYVTRAAMLSSGAFRPICTFRIGEPNCTTKRSSAARNCVTAFL
jgi:hypothetical protein